MLVWLNGNAGAVQGIAAGVSAFLTLVLVAVTWRYVLLTRTIAQSTERQLGATLQPVVAMSIDAKMSGEAILSNGVRKFHASGPMSIQNKGKAPIKLKKVQVLIRRLMDGEMLFQETTDITDHHDRVVMPDEELLGTYTAYTKYRIQSVSELTVGLVVECTDLSELLGIHTFYFHPRRGTRHSFRPVSSPGAFTELLAILRRGVKTLDKLATWENKSSEL